MNLPAVAPSRLLKMLSALARWSLVLTFGAWLLVAGAWAALHWIIVPRIGEFRTDIEVQATRALGLTVKIGSIQAQTNGLIPSVDFRDVRLLDEKGRDALVLGRVVTAVSPHSALVLGFEQIYVEAPALDVRRLANGSLVVGGITLSSGGDKQDNRAADWLFSQKEIVIRNGLLRWTDETRGGEPLALSQLDLTLRNGFRRHQMRLDAVLPQGMGDQLTVMGNFREPLLQAGGSGWENWSGQVYASFPRVDIAALGRFLDTGVTVTTGNGALRTWVEVAKGEVLEATADVVLEAVAASLSKGLAPLEMRAFTGRVAGQRLPDGFEVQTVGLQFETRDGRRWPGGNLKIRQEGLSGALGPAWVASGPTGVVGKGQLTADRIDLAALAQIADHLPLAEGPRATLALLAPKGLVEGLEVRWQGDLQAPQKISAKGRVEGLALASIGRQIPAISGATVNFDMGPAGGKAQVAIQDGFIELPGLLEQARVPLSRASADVQWQIAGDQISVQSQNLKAENADFQGQSEFKWRTSPVKGQEAQERVAVIQSFRLAAHRDANLARKTTPDAPAGATLADARFPGALDLQAQLSRAEGTRVHRYMPQAIHKEVREYLRLAIRKGQAGNVQIRVKGDLWHLPFKDVADGEFRISADVSDVTYAYVPSSFLSQGDLPWPELTQVAGNLVLDRVSLQVSNASGRLPMPNNVGNPVVANVSGAAGTPPLLISKAQASIPNLLQGLTVNVAGDAHGALSSMVAVVNQSPLGGIMGNILKDTTASGNADLNLKLALPLAALAKTSVQGRVTLAGNEVRISRATPSLGQARGVVNFSENGFSLAGLNARLLGGDVMLAGGSVPQISGAPSGLTSAGPHASGGLPGQTVVLQAKGQMSAQAMRQNTDLGILPRLAEFATGTTEYAATLGIYQGVAEITVTSNLAGLALKLPHPMGKAAETVLPIRYQTALLRDGREGRDGVAGAARPTTGTPQIPAAPDAKPARLLEQMQVQIGSLASIVYVRDIAGDTAKVLRGAVGIGLLSGETLTLPADGVSGNLKFGSIDADAWSDVLSQSTNPVVPGAPVVAASAAGARLAAAASPASDADQAAAYLPSRLAVRAAELSLGGRVLHDVVLGASRDATTWRANVEAQELGGYVEYRIPGAGSPGRVYARLSRLILAAASEKQIEGLLAEQPASIPALDIVVEDLELRGKKLGRLEVEALNRNAGPPQGGVREWRLAKFNIQLPEATLTASGNWAQLNAQTATAAQTPRVGTVPRRTVLNFQLDVADSGGLLNRLGMKDVIRGGKGKLEGQVAWLGSPITPDFPSMGGAFTVNIESGQFLKADPGLAKLLGVLSLQSLPRRLALDFRDVFSEGFSFDFVRGDVKIDQGVAFTNNLQMKGVNAAVLMEGKADLLHETQDLRVVVVPEINAGTASLVATIINPVVGLGSFLAQLILRRPLIETATQEFHIDGSWVDPRITRVQHRSEPGSSGANPKETTP